MSQTAILRHRRDDSANWTTNNPVLEDGQLGFETDTLFYKMGDGVTAWNSLPYAEASPFALGTLTDAKLAAPAAGDVLQFDGLNWVNAIAPGDVFEKQLAASDLTTDIEAGTSKAYFRAPRAFVLSEVRASLLVASTSGAVTIDVNKNGVSVFTTELTIDQDEKTSVTATVPEVIDPALASIADDDEITIDIVGAGTGAKGLIVTLIGDVAALESS